jgi:hypothetical protein
MQNVTRRQAIKRGLALTGAGIAASPIAILATEAATLDPIVALFAERNAAFAEYASHLDVSSNMAANEPGQAEAEAKTQAADSAVIAIERRILDTPAATPEGIVIKLWLVPIRRPSEFIRLP